MNCLDDDHQNNMTRPGFSSQLNLEGYIEEYGRDHSFKNLGLLRSTYRANPNRIASFVGAGVARPLGVGDWSTLMKELVKSAPNVDANYPTLGEENSTIGADQYPRIADEILEELGPDQDKFMDIIRSLTQHNEMSSTPPLEFLVKAIRIHLTTNFDGCIESTYDHLEEIMRESGGFGRRPTVKYYTEAINFRTSNNEDWICHLHADLDNNIFILAERDYKTVYKHAGGASEVHDCIKHFYLSHHLLFVGFSFDDPYVYECIRSISDEKRRGEQQYHRQFTSYSREFRPRNQAHFLLIDSSKGNTKWQELLHPEESGKEAQSMQDYFEYWQQHGVYPIVYKSGQRIFLELLFKELSRIPGDMRDV